MKGSSFIAAFVLLFAPIFPMPGARLLAQGNPPPTTRDADDATIHDLLHRMHKALANNDRKAFDSCFNVAPGTETFQKSVFEMNRAGLQFVEAAVKAYGAASLEEFKHVEWKEGDASLSGGLDLPPRDDAAIDKVEVSVDGGQATLPNHELRLEFAKKGDQWLVDPTAAFPPGADPNGAAPLYNGMAKIFTDSAAEITSAKPPVHDLAVEMVKKLQHLMFGG